LVVLLPACGEEREKEKSKISDIIHMCVPVF
jgi:hypothetical protein